MTAEAYFGDWGRVVDIREAKRILNSLSGKSVCPLPKDIFKAFHLCPLHKTRVIIIGQDPYNDLYQGKPRATGLAFANASTTPQHLYSPSLEVLRDSVIDFTVPHGTINFDPSLEKWEEQGVLLLNAALSCYHGRPDSQTLLWRPFLKTLLTNLSASETGIIYVLMGNTAQSLEPYINAGTNHIIRIRHPAYYARTKTRMPDIWKDINQMLISKYGTGIQWYQED